MQKNKVYKVVARKFELSAAAVKRDVIVIKGAEWLSARDEMMIKTYRPQYAAENGRSGSLCRQLDKHLRNIIQEDL
ncbi:MULTISPECIES: hypothetical protein [Acidithiobacillus]|uniref:Uncharacterized protein n=2 Tax=Acidithiobacillus thiooxidans TaxID=930 RepID=A0A1C2IPS4_ACITH|nr:MULTISPECIES: hypothetical protein [Acidithiobacillus]MDD2748987.1 hypothetical protein [Acidithiobacillus sp.]MDD5280196.1 hypothetical protein [Acidithiobacillus sp.]OCX72058.1 hypothetical protein A6M23_10400 [Acidithiobacillus thiooxidans]OCX78031.1 hypothetical protein A6P08_20330 [Acidithiobacillus thiooxidans]QFX95952.1 hypothetical protein GCD22_01654 [Acidithiobacillus thiooxidans ATCC 19377]